MAELKNEHSNMVMSMLSEHLDLLGVAMIPVSGQQHYNTCIMTPHLISLLSPLAEKDNRPLIRAIFNALPDALMEYYAKGFLKKRGGKTLDDNDIAKAKNYSYRTFNFLKTNFRLVDGDKSLGITQSFKQAVLDAVPEIKNRHDAFTSPWQQYTKQFEYDSWYSDVDQADEREIYSLMLDHNSQNSCPFFFMDQNIQKFCPAPAFFGFNSVLYDNAKKYNAAHKLETKEPYFIPFYFLARAALYGKGKLNYEKSIQDFDVFFDTQFEQMSRPLHQFRTEDFELRLSEINSSTNIMELSQRLNDVWLRSQHAEKGDDSPGDLLLMTNAICSSIPQYLAGLMRADELIETWDVDKMSLEELEYSEEMLSSILHRSRSHDTKPQRYGVPSKESTPPVSLLFPELALPNIAHFISSLLMRRDLHYPHYGTQFEDNVIAHFSVLLPTNTLESIVESDNVSIDVKNSLVTNHVLCVMSRLDDVKEGEVERAFSLLNRVGLKNSAELHQFTSPGIKSQQLEFYERVAENYDNYVKGKIVEDAKKASTVSNEEIIIPSARRL